MLASSCGFLWTSLFYFPNCEMMTTGRGGKSRRKIKATAVSQQSQRFMEPCLQTFPVREHAQHTARAQLSFGGMWDRAAGGDLTFLLASCVSWVLSRCGAHSASPRDVQVQEGRRLCWPCGGHWASCHGSPRAGSSPGRTGRNGGIPGSMWEWVGTESTEEL